MPAFLAFKKTNCKNCYKCINHCPVKAISFYQNQARIVAEECVLCGQCVVECPQNAKDIVSEVKKVKSLLKGTADVVASIDCTFLANYNNVCVQEVKNTLLKLGFSDVVEATLGVGLVKQEYANILKEKKQSIVISSCCHSVNLLIQKQFPNCVKYLAGVLSPMQAHCKDIKAKNPDAKCVYIGPCIAKKDEAYSLDGIVDAVLTFEELTNMLKEHNLSFDNSNTNNDKARERLFAVSGGITDAVANVSPDYTYITVDGMENCINALKDIESGGINNCFIEMWACKNGCVGGPEMEKSSTSTLKSIISIKNSAGSFEKNTSALPSFDLSREFSYKPPKTLIPNNQELEDILCQMGKSNPADELNCGCCGYDTCRQKAIAVFNGKSPVDDCIYLSKNKSESLSDHIVFENPNGVIVLDSKLKIKKINNVAKRLLNIREFSDVSGTPISKHMDEAFFRETITTRNNVLNQNIYLDQSDKYVDLSVIYVNDDNSLICLLNDLTLYTSFCERKNDAIVQSLEIADQVVQKQMRTVQEIASLLGETAAETKIAISKLKETLSDE